MEKKRKRNGIYTKEMPHKDKFIGRDIKQAQKNKEFDRDNFDSEGDDE